MHPGFYYWWSRSRRDDHGERVSACGRGGWRREGQPHRRPGHHAADFGVRRPLRYMAHKLDLDDEQIDTLAAILNVLKTERAQARIDEQRSVTAIADAVAGDDFDGDAVAKALDLRVASAERLKQEVEA